METTVTSKNGVFSAESERKAWSEYRAQKSPLLRVQLVEKYLPLARIIAAQIFAKRVNDEVEFDDYLQYARIGLLEAIDRYDPLKGIRFSSFADSRIRGAVLNALESQSEKHQQVSMSKRLATERLESCKQFLGNTVSENDINRGVDGVFRYLADVAVGMALSWLLEDVRITEFDDSASVDEPFYRSVEIKQLQARIEDSLSILGEQERKFVRYHYFQGISMSETASLLNLSRPRISQINQSAIKKLREVISKDDWSGTIY